MIVGDLWLAAALARQLWQAPAGASNETSEVGEGAYWTLWWAVVMSVNWVWWVLFRSWSSFLVFSLRGKNPSNFEAPCFEPDPLIDGIRSHHLLCRPWVEQIQRRNFQPFWHLLCLIWFGTTAGKLVGPRIQLRWALGVVLATSLDKIHHHRRRPGKSTSVGSPVLCLFCCWNFLDLSKAWVQGRRQRGTHLYGSIAMSHGCRWNMMKPGHLAADSPEARGSEWFGIWDFQIFQSDPQEPFGGPGGWRGASRSWPWLNPHFEQGWWSDDSRCLKISTWSIQKWVPKMIQGFDERWWEDGIQYITILNLLNTTKFVGRHWAWNGHNFEPHPIHAAFSACPWSRLP